MNKKDIVLFVSIFCVLALIVGGTYAYWQWESSNDQNPQVVFNTVKDIDEWVYYDGGISHFVGNFQPSSNYCGGKNSSISFYIKSGAPAQVKEAGALKASIKMTINDVSSKIQSSSAVGWVLTNGSGCSSSDILASGSFSSGTGTITLYSGITISESISSYNVWIWVNSAAGTTVLNNLAGETLDVNIWTQIDMSSVD